MSKPKPVHLNLSAPTDIGMKWVHDARSASSGIPTNDRSKVTCKKCLAWMTRNPESTAKAEE